MKPKFPVNVFWHTFWIDSPNIARSWTFSINLQSNREGYLYVARAILCSCGVVLFWTYPTVHIAAHAREHSFIDHPFRTFRHIIHDYGCNTRIVPPTVGHLPWRHVASFSIGFLLCSIGYYIFLAFHYMDSGIVATVQYCYPVFVVVIMSCCFHEKLRKTTLIASFMSIAGVAMFSLHGSENVHFSMLGMGLTLLCATQTALYVIGIQITKTNVSNGLTVTFYLMASGAFFTGLFALVDGGLALPASTGQWVDMFLLAAITGVLSNLALVESIKKLGSSLAAILGGLEPVTAMCIGIFVFGEAFTARTILGTVLIVSAVIVVMLAPRQGKHQECSSC